MEETRNLCAQVPIELHAKVARERERAGQTTSQYITQLLTDYYQIKEYGGKDTMTSTRTMAFQISEELFQRIKRHLERESARTGQKVTQRGFILGLIEDALRKAEQEASGLEARTDEATIPEDAQQEDSVENEGVGYPDAS